MAFKKFKTLGEVLKNYQISYREAPFQVIATDEAPMELKADLEFTFQKVAYDISEAAICENLIYPMLKTAWKPFSDELAIWSHQPVEFSKELSGVPDYTISRRSKLGKIVFESPYIAVVEAKKDDFTGGWAQCGLEVYTIQQINKMPEKPLFGIVSNGEIWEFAELRGSILTMYKQRFDINKTDLLFQAIQTVFKICQDEY